MIITKTHLVLAACLLVGCSVDRQSADKGDASASAAPIVDTGEAVCVRLTTNKQKFKVGEEIIIHGFVTNGTKEAVFVQSKRPFSNTRLTVRVPGRNQFNYTPYAFKKMPATDETYYTALKPGAEVPIFGLAAEAGKVHHSESYWQCIASQEKLPPPFKSTGKYTLRIDYFDLKPKKEGAYKGGSFAEVTIDIE